MTTISGGNVRIAADATGSQVDVSALTSFNSGGNALAVTNSGSVLDASLVTLNGVDVTLDGTGTLATDQWATLIGGSITVTHGTYSLPGLTNVNNSSITISGGATLSLPNLTGYSNPNTFGSATFQASGAGSTLNLAGLSTITGSGQNVVFVKALAGGHISLPALTTISGGNVRISADATGSQVDVSALTSFNSGGNALAVTNSGSVLDASLVTLNGVDVTLDGTGTLATDQWATLIGGSITVTHGTYSLPGLTNVNNSSITISGGATLSLPNLTGYSNPNTFGSATFQASGAGSTLNLAGLSTITGSGQNVVFVKVLAGGHISLPALTTISGGNVRISADATGSQVDVSALTSFNSFGGSFQVTNGGMLLDGNLTSITNVSITTDPTATFTIPSHQTYTLTSGAVTMQTGTMVDQGSITIQDNATVNLTGAFSVNSLGALSLTPLGTLHVGGNLLGNTQNAQGWNPQGTVLLNSATGATHPPQLLEAMSQDLGNVSQGFTNNFAYGTLALTTNTYAELVDQSANSSGSASEAVYVNTLIVPTGATLDLHGLNLYAQHTQINGTIISGAAIINGEVYNDVNDNGALENGEPGLAGWTVDLVNTANNATYTTTTNANGFYTLSGVSVGTYTLSEVVQPSNFQTAPASQGTYTVTVVSGQVVSNDNFGNFATATFSGQVFNDLNDNSALDGGEPGISDWTVNLVNSANTIVATATTDSGGHYAFTGVNFGTYTIQEVQRVGYQATTTSSISVAATNGLVSSGNNFGETRPAALTVILNSHTVNETDPTPASYGTITRNTSTTTALTVSLLSNDIQKLTVPATVTIPAGATSVTFPISVVNDRQIDGNETVTITASASGFITGSDRAVVVDNSLPTLHLTLADQTVSEAAGANATTGTVSITSPTSQPITIALASSDTKAATVPATVVIAAGQKSASFPIAAIDDGLDTSNRTAIITASVETDAGVIITEGFATAKLLLADANGAALTVSFAAPVVHKGSTATATISRNTSTTDSLIVSLSSSDPTKAAVPATVSIPAGQTSVSFAVATIDDHIPHGLQQVQIFAKVTGLDTGIASLGITDVALPDLVVSNVTTPPSGYDNSPLPISWTVTNNGQYRESGSWLDQVYLDPVGGPQSSSPVATVTFTGTVNAAQSYLQTATLSFPSTVGQYIARVVTNTDQSVEELSFSNNTGTSAQPMNDQASYSATVSTNVITVSNGTPIPLFGVATLASTGAPAADVPVAVQILVAGTTRTLTATTDSSGHYSVTFQPLQNEAGEYSAAAAEPSVTNPAVQAQFEIVGMTASPASANVHVVPNTPLTGQFTLTNLSNVTLTGLTATARGGPAGLSVQLTAPSQIAGDGTATLAYSLNSTSAQAASGVVTIHVTTTQGAVLDILLEVTVLPLRPALAANPGFLNSGMVVGAQRLISFTVVNNGGAPSGELQVSLPQTSYLSLASPATIPSLAPGVSSTVTIELTPASNLPLEEYIGTIGIGGAQTGISVPFTFTAITTAVGDVHVLVDDDYTFDVVGAPRVQGATVNLLNPYDNTQIVATGVTDATGAVTFSNVPAGTYDLQVQATGHSSYMSAFTVVPGITNNDEVFIARQFVSYTWNVVQTTIQDTYQIQLETEFQTDVPAPVVTITAPPAIPTLQPGQSASFNVTITNHGLIAAQDVTLELPTDPEYTFTALTDEIGVLPAKSSVVVPITVTRAAPQSVSISDGGTMLTTKMEIPDPIEPAVASTVYVKYSNTGTVAIPAPLLVLTATQDGNQGAFLSLDPSLAGLGYNSDTLPAGFSQTVQFLARGATPGVLEPGESVTVPVYYAGWLASQWSESPVTFSLSEVGTDDTQAIDWPSVAPAIRPDSINVAAWNAITPMLAAALGSTWGQYIQTLDNDAAYLDGIGEPTSDLSQLLSFEIEKANAAYTAQKLVSVTADDLPAPGMDLTFVQSFQQAISGRYTEGILGFGWTTNWDISATTMANGDVVVEDDGVSVSFSLQPNGSFAPGAGDQGTSLTATNGAYQFVKPDGTVFQFNTNGTLKYVQDTNGNRITAGYNAQGQLASLTDSNGEYLDLTYNAQGHLSQLTDSNGQTETYGYDPTGHFLTSYTDIYGTTNYTYITASSAAQNNALAEIAYADNTHIYFTYDAQGRLIDQRLDGGAEDQHFSYLTPGGYVTTDGNGNKTTTYFDLFGATAETIDPLGNVTRYHYDSNLNLVQEIDPGGLVSSYSHDANGNLTSKTDPLGNTTVFTYNANNNLTSYTDAKGNTTSYAYDNHQNLLSVAYANGTSQQYSYDPLGEATQFLNANGDAIGFTYNAAGLLTQETFADGTSFSYNYNAQGRMTSATDAAGSVTTFVYGDAGNPTLLTEVEYPDGTWLKFTYNIVGHRTQSVDQSGFTVNYSYDSVGRLQQLTDLSGNLIVQYSYDNAGNLSQKNNGNGTFTLYTYDGNGDVQSITNYAPSTGASSYVPANSAVNSFNTYTYDDLGNVLTDTSQDGQWGYSYDADSELIQAVFTPNASDPGGLTAQTLQYAYDAAGNRTSETVNGVATSYVVNKVNEYTSSTTVGVGTTTYLYDADGNLISMAAPGGTTTYTFNKLDELTGVSGPGRTANFGYDPLGHLVSQTVNGVVTKFQIDPAGIGNVVATFGAAGALTAHYTYGLGLVSQSGPSGTGYYDFDASANAIGISGSSGTYVNHYSYLPFGETTTVSAALPNPFTFVGQFGVMQIDSNLFYMRARDYVPGNGVFLSPDPLGLAGGQTNLNIYVGNDPIAYVDPTGLGPQNSAAAAARGVKNGSPDSNIGRLPPMAAGPANGDNPKIRMKENRDGTFGPLIQLPHNVTDKTKGGTAYRHYRPGHFQPNKPQPGGAKNGGKGAVGGKCTLLYKANHNIKCGPNSVAGQSFTTQSVHGRICNSQSVAHTVSGAGGGSFVGGGGGGAPSPGVAGTVQCDPVIKRLLDKVPPAKKRAGDPPIDTAPAVMGTDDAANAAGLSSHESPATFMATALGNLGLLDGQVGNDGYTAAQAAQMVSTIATFDQTEANLSDILATAAGNSSSLGITGDINLLQTINARLEAVTAAEDLLFGGNANWLNTNQAATLQQWVTAFFADVQASGDGTISAAASAQLLATTLPSTVSISEAMEFLNRWNLTVQYWGQGTYTAAQVPAGQSTDFLDLSAIQTAFNAAVIAEQESQVAGYSDVGAEVQGDLNLVENDLAGQGVCARVKLQIDQAATLTRSAFSGTLSITNSEETGDMTNVVMHIAITDAQGNPANGEFYVSSANYSGAFSVVNGNATLPDNSTGTISFTFIPNNTAAPSAPTLYDIGGTIGFTDPSGAAVSVPVFPATITVYPQAQLDVNYFLQQAVIGDDPFTPQVEPSEPAVLGMLVTNVGAGTANNLSITTAQPQITQNEKGLLVNFQIIGTQVGTQQVTPSLTVGLGAIAPGQTADADFLLRSSLQGTFTNFTASFTHTNALGGQATSLISSVQTHTLIHAGNFNSPGSAGGIDYLAEDNANIGNLPDTIYFSNGTTAPINVATGAAASQVGSSSQLTYQVTANVTSGWSYIQLRDPGAGYTLYKVVRSDGTVIPISDEAWTTDRTISSTGKSTVDYELHILDDNSTGSYIVYYKPTTATAPTVISLSTVSSPQSGPVGSIDVTFSEPIDPSTFTTADLSLILNDGPNLINSSVTVTQDSPTKFTIGGLSALTAADGNYTLTVSATDLSDFFGDAGTGSKSTSWATGTDVPVVVSVGGGNPILRNTPLATVDVVLSEPIDPRSFDYHAISLTLDGGPNLITSDVTVTKIAPTTYRIGGLETLTTVDGDYALKVNAAGLVDGLGNSGVGALTGTWTMDTVGPTIVSLPTYIQSPRNIVVPSIDVIFSEPIDPTTFTYQNITYSKEGGPNLIAAGITIAQLSPTEFEISNFNNLLLPIDGAYKFTVSAAGVEDLAGNMGSGSASDTWELVTSALAAPTDLAITPSTGVTPGLTGTGLVTLTGTLSELGLTVGVFDGDTDLGFANVNDTSFSIALNLSPGAHQLKVVADDDAGNISSSSTFNVFVDETPLEISSIAGPAPNPRNTAAGSVDVTFSKPIIPATFTSADLALSDNNGPNLITSAVTISLISGSTYRIGGLAGLTVAEGAYTLTVNGSGIQDLAGNGGTGSLSTSWLMDTTSPTSTVSALPPVETSTSFTVSVTGSDPSGSNGSTSSGIASFAIYASTDGGPFDLLKTVTPTVPSLTFIGQAGHTYGFYSVATDNAGNVEQKLAQTEATTTVSGLQSATITTVNSDHPSGSTYGQSVLFTVTVSAAAGTPTGSVQLQVDGANYTEPVLLINGIANVPARLPAGQHSVVAFYTSDTSGFNGSDDSANPFQQLITTATPTIVASDVGGAYNGNPFPATATATGIGGATVNGSFAFTYYVGTSASGSGFSTAPTNAGTYTVVAAFTSTDSNYGNAQSAPLTFTITTATPTVVASDAGGTYNGNPFPAAATVKGIGGATISGDFAFTYYVGTSVSGTGSATAPTNAGTYTVVASFTSTNSNYGNGQSAPVTFTVSAATPTVVASDTGGTYNGNPFAATATAKGIGGATVNGSFAFTYYVGTSASGSGFSTAPTNAGTYTVVASFTSTNSNYGNGQSAPVTFTVSVATPTVVAIDAGGTYNGNLFPATATAKGIGGATVNGSFAFRYYVGTSVSGSGSSTAPTNAGTYTVVASFTSTNSNYGNAQSAPVTFTVSAATPTVVASDAGGTYNGNPFAATATVKGIGGATVNGSFAFRYYVGTSVSGSGSSTAPTNAGTYTVVAAFTSTNSNYGNAQSAPVTFSITTATPTVVASAAGGTYNGNPFPATATAKGIGGTTVSGNFAFTYYIGTRANGRRSSTAPTNAGTYTVVAAFTSTNSNYGDAQSVPLTLIVTPAALTITADNKTKVVGAANPPLTFTATGLVNGDTVASLTRQPTLSTSATTASPVGAYPITVSGAVDANYTITYVAGTLSVTPVTISTTTKVTSSINPSAFGQAVTFTATVTAASGTTRPTGIVTFKDGTTILGIGTLSVVRGVVQTTFSTSSLTIGTHSITAVYAGSSNFIGSTSTTLSEVVGKAATTTTISASSNPAGVGQNVTFTAVVNAVTGTPTGTVTFKDGNTILGTATLSVVRGVNQVTFSTSSLSNGNHSITAIYVGSASYNSSTALAITERVIRGLLPASAAVAAAISIPSTVSTGATGANGIGAVAATSPSAIAQPNSGTSTSIPSSNPTDLASSSISRPKQNRASSKAVDLVHASSQDADWLLVDAHLRDDASWYGM